MSEKLRSFMTGNKDKEFTKYIVEMIDEMKQLRLAIEKLCNKMEKK